MEKMATDKTSLSIFTADELLRIAAAGEVAVIRGWGANHLLESVPHVLRLRVCAPFDFRVTRMMERLSTTDQAAVEKKVRLSDEAAAAITRRHFDVKWSDAIHYDLVLNTERISVDDCADQVMHMLSKPRFSESPESSQRLSDLAMAARVRAALRSDEHTRHPNFTINAHKGHVILSGIVETDHALNCAATVAAAVPGIAGVTNNLKAMSAGYRRFGGDRPT